MTLIRWRNSQNFNIRPYILAHLSKSELFCFIFVIFACAQMRQPLLRFVIIVDCASRIDRAGHPDVSSYDRAVSDLGITSEYRRVCVDDAVVAYIGMALDALDGIAVFIELKALSTQGNALIYLNSVRPYLFSVI